MSDVDNDSRLLDNMQPVCVLPNPASLIGRHSGCDNPSA